VSVLPTRLYGLTERDIGAPYASVYLPAESFAVGAPGTLSAILQVTNDRPILLTNACCMWLPGAGQTLSHGFLEIGPDNTVAGQRAIAYFTSPVGLGAGLRVVGNWSGEVIVPPGYFIRARGEFNAGANNNTSVIQAMGMGIPQGNIVLP
jgi:hypothetical protein